MKTLEELKKFYETDLVPELKVLEQQRKRIVGKFKYVAIVLLCLTTVMVLLLWEHFKAKPIFIIMPFIGCAVVAGVICNFMKMGYVMDFKAMIIRRIVRFIEKDLSYSQRGYIPKSVFLSSKIFSVKPNRYKGDDLVSGTVGATKIEFSEIRAEHESGSGKNRRRYTIFKGLFFIGDFNKHFLGKTVVLPDRAEKLLGKLGQKLQSLNIFRGELIKLEDPEFERHFAVYGDNQIEARYILSTSLMKRIVDFKKKTGRKIYMSFVGSQVFVAVSYTRKLFEPRLFKTLLDFGPIRRYFEDLELAIGIVDDLNLNTRIWSKG